MKISEEKIYFGLFFALLFCALMYGIGRIYGIIYYPDEFGYWALAGELIGYDWSDIASLGSYYSFGYSILLYPILLLTQSGTTAYRIAVIINFVLLFLTYFLLTGYAKKIMDTYSRLKLFCFSAIAVCYPVWIFYSQTTLVEILLVFFYVLSFVFLDRLLDQVTYVRIIQIGIVLVYTYSIHMRAIAVIIAGVCMLILYAIYIKKERKKIIIALAYILCLLFLYAFIKELSVELVWKNAGKEIFAKNDFAGQWKKLLDMLTWTGFCEVLLGALGKIYYLGCASFGLFYFGIGYVVIEIKKGFEEKVKNKNWFLFIFLILSVIGAIGINAIYCKGYERFDALLYGRYDEYILPVFILLGCKVLWESADLKKMWTGISTMQTLMTLILTLVIKKHDITNLHDGYFISGISYLLPFVKFEPDNYLWYVNGFTLVIMSFLFLLFAFVKRKRELSWMLIVPICIEYVGGIYLCEQYTYFYNMNTYGNNKMSGVIEDKLEQEDRRLVSLGNNEDDTFISSIQFQLMTQKIFLFQENEIEKLQYEDLVIVSGLYKEESWLQEKYSEWEEYGAFKLYYNEREQQK